MIGGSSPSSLPSLIAHYEQISFGFSQRPHSEPTWSASMFSLVVPESTNFSYSHCLLNKKIIPYRSSTLIRRDFGESYSNWRVPGLTLVLLEHSETIVSCLCFLWLFTQSFSHYVVNHSQRSYSQFRFWYFGPGCRGDSFAFTLHFSLYTNIQEWECTCSHTLVFFFRRPLQQYYHKFFYTIYKRNGHTDRFCCHSRSCNCLVGKLKGCVNSLFDCKENYNRSIIRLQEREDI